jgi:hypothetical protein
MDENLIGYLLNALDADEQRRIEEYLRDNAGARRKLEILRAALSPLATDSAAPEPPAGLVERTMARVASVFVRPKIRVPIAGSEPVYAPSRWRRVDALVACCILVLLGGLGTSGLARVHQMRERARCQDTLRQYYQSLTGFAAFHNGALPAIADQPPNNFAGAFQPILVNAGQLPPHLQLNCPSAPTDARAVAYTYALGYRDNSGRLHGLVLRPVDGDEQTMPIMADVPQAMPHGRGFNVLFVSGAVRFSLVPNVGIDGDDIFVNDLFEVKAGLRRPDSVLATGDISP